MMMLPAAVAASAAKSIAGGVLHAVVVVDGISNLQEEEEIQAAVSHPASLIMPL